LGGGFYSEESLEVVDIELRIEPLRFCLDTFRKAGTDEAFYAAVLLDGTITEPIDEKEI
jgi:hypothetical protein